jgi:hypothetical protein
MRSVKKMMAAVDAVTHIMMIGAPIPAWLAHQAPSRAKPIFAGNNDIDRSDRKPMRDILGSLL